MYTNQDFCTVYEKTVDSETRMEAYIRHLIPDIYWQKQTGEKNGGKSSPPEDSVLCVIPAGSLSDYLPKRGDLLVCGICTETIPNEEHFTVTNVKKFLYGSKSVQHIEVTAV